MPYSFSWIRQVSQLGTLLATRFCGEGVGVDSYGNRYFTERKKKDPAAQVRRWVVYAGEPDPSRIPPEWHSWLHFVSEEPLVATDIYPWQQPHEPNQTGTSSAYYPPGHTLSGKERPPATGDYEAWRPTE